MSPESDYSNVHIESTLPKPWEQEQTFNDVLYDWMGRAPWLLISAAAHLLAFFILAAIPWDVFKPEPVKVIEATIAAPPEQIFEEPPEEEPEELEEEVIEEPVLKDAEITETEELVDYEEAEGEPDFTSDSPFDAEAFNDVIGIGGGAGGKFGGRFGRGGGRGGGAGIQQALKDALEWLKAHQSPEGYWDADNFMSNCGKIGSTTCDGEGNAVHDVGMTGLALLAFLGDGNTTTEGLYRDVVANGVNWLRQQQDPDTGLIGERTSRDFLYDHGIASLALAEAYYFSKSPVLRGSAQAAIDYIHRARNPYGAWRYDVPPVGDNDTSITGWMLFALASAKEAGLNVDPAALEGGLQWIDDVTDPATGRVGYNAFGTLSSRTPTNEHFPREKGEAMTAVGLLCRIFLGQKPEENPIMIKHAELLQRKPPVWEPGVGSDMYYWYYATYAMFQMGGEYWRAWEKPMEQAIVQTQRKDGDAKGSWDPVGPWGHDGGRVYSTALMTLCLEVYFRYAKVLGAR